MDLVGFNAKFGDGCLSIGKSSKNARASFSGKNVQWISFKRDLFSTSEYKIGKMGARYSGYKDTFSLVGFSIGADVRLTEAYYKPTSEALSEMTKHDLLLWYIDDGSWHKVRHTMHLYSNMLNDEETDTLIKRIEYLYGIAPRKRVDRKKDGRSYLYLYFPRKLVEIFRYEVLDFLKTNELDTLLYKVGETSTTSESVGSERTRNGEHPKG